MMHDEFDEAFMRRMRWHNRWLVFVHWTKVTLGVLTFYLIGGLIFALAWFTIYGILQWVNP